MGKRERGNRVSKRRKVDLDIDEIESREMRNIGCVRDKLWSI